MESTHVWNALLRPPWRFLLGAWPWRALAYLLFSAVLGLVLLPVILVTLLLLPLWGLLIGALERRRTRMLGFPAQVSAHAKVPAEERHQWLGIRLTEAATWRETGAAVLDVLVGAVISGVLALEAAVLTVLVALGVSGFDRVTELILFNDVRVRMAPDTWWLTVFAMLAALMVFAYVNTLLAGSQASLLRILCGPREAELARNVERLTRSRAALVQAFEDERRRIERDLHDGVQQELVTLTARLGLVILEVDELTDAGVDTSGARRALGATQDQAEHALATLRRTVRGIHPAVLTDHGLAAALNELADRTALPLDLDTTGLRRLPVAMETAAYYLASEALTNAAKHTAASRVSVTATATDAALVITAEDDGHGGADENSGTGLRGLRERAETLNGAFTIDSPPGGPTLLRMALPIPVENGRRHAPAAR